MSNNDYPIDIVIPWVDSTDPEWLKEHDKYQADKNSDNSSARYRDWNLLKYWFRSIDKNAPWVRTIHFLTFGHVPVWLNTDNPKLHIVRHEEFIPEQYLPTFSSHTIELNLHRIPGLAEHFIYFNDDVYLSQPAERTDFFQNGFPVDRAVMGVIKNDNVDNYMPYIMLNMLALINMSYSKKAVLIRDWGKWFNLHYGIGFLLNLYLAPWPVFTGFRNYHTAIPYTKKILEQVWEQYPEQLIESCLRKFRSKSDVNQYLFRYVQLMEGEFVPGKNNSCYFTIGSQPAETIVDAMTNKKVKLVCINDDPMGFVFEQEQKVLESMFCNLFPDNSGFERVME